MAIPTSKISITELDFNTIKASLKSFLQAQTEFQDYDFEGSGLSVLLDVLAANTHYQAFYLNMALNEMFLDSASRRSSIVSIAKQLAYTPRSRKSATATVDLTIVPDNPGTAPAKITIEKNTKFTTTIDDETFTFVSTKARTVDYDSVNEQYVATGLEIKEGVPLTHTFTVDSTVPDQEFIIPNANVDTETISVSVREALGSADLVVYTKAVDINELTPQSVVFFLEEVEEQKFRVFFGDDILGKAVQDGNIVIIDYLVSSAAAPNKASTFTAAQDIAGFSDITVNTTQEAFGGAERETLESVRFTAPKNFAAQGRAVTKNDFETIIEREVPNVDSVAVWGGDTAVPPQYGKVFISIKPVVGFVLTNAVKEDVKEIIEEFNVVTILPEVVDAEFIHLVINSEVKYNEKDTRLTADQIKQLVLNTISTFADEDIGKFNKAFLYSKFTKDIDNTEFSITNNLTNVSVQKRFTPTIGQFLKYTLEFNNSLEPGSLTSGTFITTQDPVISHITGSVYDFEDDENGIIRIVRIIGTDRTVVKNNVGTIDYTTGKVELSFIPSSITDPDGIMKITAKPQKNDIIPQRNDIINLELADTTITMVANTQN